MLKTTYLLLAYMAIPCHGGPSDRFNYYGTEQRDDENYDYGPEDWGDIECTDIDDCIGFPDKWHTGRGWEIQRNACRWCPDNGSNRCGRHHQSPINLERNRGIEGHVKANECIDVHWMKYEDSTCKWEHLQNAASIERFALRIAQPIRIVDSATDDYTLQCFENGVGRRYGRIDFSKGFSQWWFLSHIDFKVPSEHLQEGKRYSAEVQMYHFYSFPGADAGVDNEMATVTMFMEAFDNAPPDPYLDKLICLWRRQEDLNRKLCDKEPVSDYNGCFPIRRTAKSNNNNQRDRQLNEYYNIRRKKYRSSPHPEFQTIHELIMYNQQLVNHNDIILNATNRPKLVMDGVNFEPANEAIDWDTFIAQESKKMQERDKLYQSHVKQNTTHVFNEEHRNLIENNHIPWFNYWPMLSVRTEYYYRYSGTQTIPPCHGKFIPGTRKGTNHWRVLKDPIRISKNQLREMKRLLRDRLAPYNDPIEEIRCQPDTAGKKIGTNDIDVARPVQYFHDIHYKTFCECKDWESKWPEDRKWCAMDDVNDRFYTKPYNWEHTGF